MHLPDIFYPERCVRHALRWAAWLVACLFFATASAGQVSDNFSDVNLTDSPAWQGDVANFQVNAALQLQLNAPGGGTSSLFLPTAIADSALWELYFFLDFDPSNGNRLRVYLQADSPNLPTANGYFLQVGDDGSLDAIKFYRQDAGTAVLLASATASAVASSPKVRLRMAREPGGQWKLSADYTGGGNLALELTATDAVYGGGDHFFGFHCTYTATRRDKFYFDDLLVAPLLPDTQPPTLLSATAISATEVDVVFSEELDENPASEPASYAVSNGIGMPQAAMLDGADPTLVHLSLAQPLQNLGNYTLTATGLSDLAGNAAGQQSVDFGYVVVAQPAAFDVLINEIMADPSPKLTLPEMEFVELYNRSDKPIDLASLRFSSGGAPQIFPSYLLLPGAYVLVCDDSKADSLAAYGNVVGLGSFPALSNESDELLLTDAAGNVIHQVIYALATYGDPVKSEGGWTLELANPLAPCILEGNWRASENPLGGTPGQPNSVFAPQADNSPPTLLEAFASPATPTLVTLFFDKKLDPASALDPANYAVSGIGVLAVATGEAANSVQLTLAAPLQTSQVYEITVSGVADCQGIALSGTATVSVVLPSPIGPQEIVVNEILFNPATGGVDFLEVYNRSDKVFNLGDLVIGSVRLGLFTSAADVKTDRLFYPGEYAVFTEDPSDIESRYVVNTPNNLIINDLPSFNDDAGNVTLFRAAATDVVVVDSFGYAEAMHHPLLDDVDGVSLERLHPDQPTNDPGNWHSAAQAAGFATPTYQNSQFLGELPVSDGIFDIPEPSFSPDGDGDRDFLPIYYTLEQPGYTAKVRIFDAEGRPVKTLANNELLATEGILRWDGDTDDGEKARVGIYVVWAQLFTPNGKVQEFKKPCVVAF